MKFVYLCHPVKGSTPEETDANIERAKRWVRWVYDNHPDVFVMAMWIVDCQVLDDANPVHRAAGMMRNAEAIPHCDEGWLVGGTVSEGMSDEMRMLLLHGKGIRDLTKLGDEPPVTKADLPGLIVLPPKGVEGWGD